MSDRDDQAENGEAETPPFAPRSPRPGGGIEDGYQGPDRAEDRTKPPGGSGVPDKPDGK